MISVAIECVNFSHTDKLNKYTQWLKLSTITPLNYIHCYAALFIMKKYATAYVSLFENNAIANVIEAENELEAMKKAILLNQKDEYTKEWIEGLGEMTIEEFKDAVLQGEQSVDAVEI